MAKRKEHPKPAKKPKKPAQPKEVKPKGGGKLVEADKIGQVFTDVRNIVLGIKNVHAVSAIPWQGTDFKIRITLDEAGSPTEAEVLNEIGQVANLVASDVIFVRSKPLRMFAPYPVCAQYYNHSNEMDVKGSCGPFFSRGNQLYLMSCAHVLPGKKEDLRVAQLHYITSVEAKVVHSDASKDIGIAEVVTPIGVYWSLFPTNIIAPVLNEYVSHFGSASVEESNGYVKAVLSSAIIEGVTFTDVVHLGINSRHGDSGSPVVNNKNEVIGMIIGGDAEHGDIYCSDLSKFRWPDGLKYEKVYLNGTADRPWIKDRYSRRREIELQLHCGRIIKNETPDSYGEIITEGGVSVLTSYDHSFSDEKIDTGKDVWFFAVPLENVVNEVAMVGANNSSPLLAINVSNHKRQMVALNGLHRRNPCGTETTI